MEKIFFQSSLPRAGSTLLQNIMGQNPDFYVTPTSGFLELIYTSRQSYSSSEEFLAQDKDIMKKAFLSFCRGGMNSFFEAITDKKYVMDKSRGWGVHYGLLNSFYPNPKIICMIRDPRAIFSSMEKNFRKNPHIETGTVNHVEMTGTTTEKRIDMWSSSPPIGMALERLYQMVKEGIDKKVLIIKFEDLTFNPENEIKKVYNFLELPQFKHDFNNIKQVTQEDDRVYGIYGDHQIKNKIQPLKKDYNQILGNEASDWIKNNYKWFYDTFKYY